MILSNSIKNIVIFHKFYLLTDIGLSPDSWHVRIASQKVLMTAYEIITIFIGIFALLMSFGSLKMPILAAHRIGYVRKDITT